MSRRPARPLATGTAMLCLIVAPTGCTEVQSAEVEGYQPSQVTEAGGSKVVAFTAEGARRVDLRTTRVRRVGGRPIVPSEAVLYEADGRPFVYLVIGPRRFRRAGVVIDRPVGDRVLLADGPPAGSAVVARGAAEVYGTEHDIAGSH